MMRSALFIPLLSPLLVLAGCLNSAKTGDGGTDGGGEMLQFYGGTIMVPGCGYAVTTREGASAPIAGSAMLGADATPWSIHLGLATDPGTSMVVLWRTNDETTLATTVQFGMSGKTDQATDGLTFAYQVPNGDNVRIHETHLCGLQPGTTYSYRVGGKDKSGAEKWSDVFTFRTAPDKAKADAQVVIGVIGDTRGGYIEWGKMLKLLQTTGAPDLILFSGDAVLLGSLQKEWDTFFRNGEPVLHSIPLVGAHGNHDDNSVNYFSQLAMPGDEEYYGITYGPAHVTVVNDNPPSQPLLATKGAPFLEQDLTANDAAPWKFVMHHRPLYSSAVAHGSDMNLQMLWGPIIDKHKVDMVFNGHDHDYERTKPLRAGQPQAKVTDGTTFVVAGSAGAPLYDSGTSGFTAFSKSTYNFVVIKLRAGNLDMKAYDDTGAVIDMMTIAK